MKRILLIVAVLFIAVCANAQRVTFWYGINCGKETNYFSGNNDYDYRYIPNFPDEGYWYIDSNGNKGHGYSALAPNKIGMKTRRVCFGIDYTAPISEKFEWTVGAGLNEKGSMYKISYAQIEGNVQYKLFAKNSWTIAQFAGLFGSVRTTSNEELEGNFNSFLFGIQGGMTVMYKRLSLKVGCEQSLTNIGENTKTFEWFARLGVSLFRK